MAVCWIFNKSYLSQSHRTKTFLLTLQSDIIVLHGLYEAVFFNQLVLKKAQGKKLKAPGNKKRIRETSRLYQKDICQLISLSFSYFVNGEFGTILSQNRRWYGVDENRNAGRYLR